MQATLVNQPAFLALADGTVFEGLSFGAPVLRAGEVVFNTAMTGYRRSSVIPPTPVSWSP